MKKIFIPLILAITLCSAGIAIAGGSKTEPAEAQDIYTLSVTCPKCYGSISARFEENLSTVTYGNCSKCHKRFRIKYVWKGSDDRPEIKEITEVR